MEDRMAGNFEKVYERFDQNDKRHFTFAKRTEDAEKEINDRITNNDAQIANIMATDEEQDGLISDIQTNAENLQKQIDENNMMNDRRLNEKFTKLLDKQNYAEKETNQSFQILGKEIEKLKFELGDMIDQKFDFIQKNVET